MEQPPTITPEPVESSPQLSVIPPSSVTPSQTSSQTPSVHDFSRGPLVMSYLGIFFSLLLGLGIGFAFGNANQKAYTDQETSNQAKVQEFKLPIDASEIQQCATGKGTLYARPQDVPYGPVYMVYSGKVVGIEYMVEREEFLKGEGMKHLPVQHVPVDHVNVGILEEGHAGFPGQHFHIDLYTISHAAENAITCPNGSDEHMVMPGMDMDASPSAVVTESMKMDTMKMETSSSPAVMKK
jgi:hypothetical protein